MKQKTQSTLLTRTSARDGHLILGPGGETLIRGGNALLRESLILKNLLYFMYIIYLVQRRKKNNYIKIEIVKVSKFIRNPVFKSAFQKG